MVNLDSDKQLFDRNAHDARHHTRRRYWIAALEQAFDVELDGLADHALDLSARLSRRDATW
jgi:hypothetical protein